MTTLEWLLVVAAVAGLAALAVVLVQNVVGDTAEQVASHDARQTAAELAVADVQRQWRAETPTLATEDEINRLYAQKCSRLGIIYADISLSVKPPKPGKALTGGGWDPNVLPTCTLA